MWVPAGLGKYISSLTVYIINFGFAVWENLSFLKFTFISIKVFIGYVFCAFLSMCVLLYLKSVLF